MHKALIAFLLFSSAVSAQIESIIQFNGQNAETITLNKSVNVVRSEAYDYEDTCSRDIPYEVYECNNVTRYRQECSWIPASERCWTEPDRVCRSVTRYRRQCSPGPSRQVCTSIPTRQVCVERPTREVCRTDSSGQQRCQTVGGGQSCQTVGGGQNCRTESGPEVCRDVAYQDQDCDTVYRNRCETIPGRNDCRDIPYQEQVCGNVTRYNTEYYACTRTGYRDVTTVKKLSGEINVALNTNGVVEEFPIAIVLAPQSATHESFTLTTSLKKEPKALVASQLRKIEVLEETDKEIIVRGSVTIEMIDAEQIALSFPVALNNVAIGKDSHVVSMDLEGSISAVGSVEVELMHTPLVGKDKKIASLKAEYPSEQVRINGNKMEINLKGQLMDSLQKRMVLNVKLSAPISLPGDILNAKKPENEKSYNKLKIKQM